MGLEEQQEEREVLDSIFPDEITDVHDRANTFRIATKLDVPTLGEEDEAPTIILQVSYPEEYPDVAPDLDILPAGDAPKHPLLDVPTDKAQLLEQLQDTIEESLGMQMVFSIHATLKENAEQLITQRIAEAEAREEAVKREIEAKENAKFHGTQVNPETFIKWRDDFVKEIAEKEQKEIDEKEAEEKKKRGRLEEKKLTGRQLWEQGLVGKVDEEGFEGEDGITPGVAKVAVST